MHAAQGPVPLTIFKHEPIFEVCNYHPPEKTNGKASLKENF